MKKNIMLPAPQKDLDFPLMKALEIRRTVRKWKDETLTAQDLSNLLWAACGINKEQYGNVKCKRTAPSACNCQEIRVYAVLAEGMFLYDEAAHELTGILSDDIREDVGTQKMMKTAPMGLVYAADLSRMNSPFLRRDDAKRFSAWVDTGFISQNVYLYCAAANLGTAVLSLVNKERLHKRMKAAGA